MKYSELEKLQKKNRCVVYREGSGHTIWQNKSTGKKFPISRHKTQEVPLGTLKSILKDAGIDYITGI